MESKANKEFTLLKINIRKKMWELEELQKLYRHVTGQDYQIPFYLDLDGAKKSDEAYLQALK